MVSLPQRSFELGMYGFGTKCIFAVFCIGIVISRMPDRFFNAQLYAEDGYLYEQALRYGWHSLGMPYGGYLLTAQRLIAWCGVIIPPLYAPLFFNVMALGAVVLVGARLASSRVKLSGKPWLILALVLWPHTEDIFVTMENMMWVVSLSLLLLSITDDAATKMALVTDSLVVFLSGLTGVYAILFLPLFILRAFMKKSFASYFILVLVMVTATVQLYFVIHSPKQDVHGPVPWGDLIYIPSIIGYRAIAQLFGGKAFLTLGFHALSILGIGACIGISSLGCIKVNSKSERNTRLILLLALIITGAASVFRLKYSLPILISPEALGRYFFIPQICLLWLIAFETSKGGKRKLVAVSCAGLFIFTSLSFYKVPALKDMHWKSESKRVVKGNYYDILINPEGWHFRSENSGF
jgi:hypothetical protein